jgi:hypothetical protein
LKPSVSAPLPNRRYHYSLPDLNAFAQITAESAYWLGFLMADGCITSRQVILVLQLCDEPHTREFLKFAGCADRPSRLANHGRGVRVVISSAPLARQLTAFGLAAGRKPLAEVIPELASSPDFWRGVVDGDGTVKTSSNAGMPQVSLVGYPRLVAQFSMFLSGVFSDGYAPRPYRHSQSAAVRLVSMSGRRAQAAARALYYQGARYALPRKRIRAEAIDRWDPRVRSAYPWGEWLDGRTWHLVRNVDYDSSRRLWESGRKVAAQAGVRLVLTDHGGGVVLWAGPGAGTSWRRIAAAENGS